MSVTGQISLARPDEELRLYFRVADLPRVVDEAKPGDTITLHPGDFSGFSDSIDLLDGIFMTVLPGAIIDYTEFDQANIKYIADLNRLSHIDDILFTIDSLLDEADSNADGKMLYYDAFEDQLKYSDLILIDDVTGQVTVTGSMDVQDELTLGGDEGTLDFRLDRLEGLLPSAPPLDQITASSGSVGKLSFGPSNAISGVTDVPSADVGDTFNVTGDQYGIVGMNTSYVSGVINEDVTASNEHNADVFGKAEVGTLRLIVNGSEIISARINLNSTSNSISTVASDTGLSVSASQNLTYPDGDTYTYEKQRSGTWQVSTGDLQPGYNTIKVQHYDGDNNLISETQSVEYVLDNDVSTISFSNLGFDNLTTSGSMYLSGVEYHTDVQADLVADISDVYRNTYDTGNAISFPTTTNFNLNPIPIPDPSTHSDTINLSEAVSPSDRIINDGFVVQIEVSDPVESNETSSTFSDFNLLVDKATNQDTFLDNHFDSEDYRIPSNEDFNTDISTGSYNSLQTIKDGGSSGYNDQLQVTDSSLIYPVANYSTISDGPSSNPDYSTGVTGQRTFYGMFSDPTSAQNFVLRIYGSATIISEIDSFTNGSDEIKVSFKLPTQTGWLDVSEDWIAGNYNDGDGGANPTFGTDYVVDSSGTEIGITSGTKSTANSFDKIYYRITAAENWSGSLERISIDWNVS